VEKAKVSLSSAACAGHHRHFWHRDCAQAFIKSTGWYGSNAALKMELDAEAIQGARLDEA
jgi:hypothetical protein